MRAIDGPFALTIHERNTNRLYCVNEAAERQGLHRGMPHSDARAFVPDLLSQPVDLVADKRFLLGLRRWATRYCPWVGIEGRDGLVLDVTGSTHLFGSEEQMLGDMRERFDRLGITVRAGCADTRGAAWALAHYREGIAPAGDADMLQSLPVAALRLDEKTSVALQRLGLRKISDLTAAARAPLARRFGPDLLWRLDQLLGAQPESVRPLVEPPHYAVRMTLPEPVGLTEDVMMGTSRLLERLCEKLAVNQSGARILCLTLRRVDQESQQVELRLARPMRDAARILPLFERGVAEVDAGFGIDQMRLQATAVEELPPAQVMSAGEPQADQLNDLITRLGGRIGLENIMRFLPVDSHIPERSFVTVPVAYSESASGGWASSSPRPVKLFPPEAIAGIGATPPTQFRWRRIALTTAKATGPERIAPEWWFDDDSWRSGLRDYWRVETRQGRRLWMFHTPQNPGWFVQGEFA